MVTLARAWTRVFAWLPIARATNLLSAVSTALAGAALAWVLARRIGAPLAAAAGAITAGAMSTVWSNATETEVYSISLLLSMLALAAAERAGQSGDRRWTACCVYALALAVPLHLSALVVAPGVIVLASTDGEGAWHLDRSLVLAAATLAIAGAGLANAWLVAAGALALASLIVGRRDARISGMLAAGAIVLGLSALAILPVRATHEPWLNSGHPTSWQAVWALVGRRQYGGTPVWPRQAPLWIQLGNWFEYADWQFALGLAPDVAPAWWRTPITVCFAALGLFGAWWQRARDRGSFRAFAVLFASASLGLVLYLNFKAGASYGWGVLPESAPHEARDRDYFFVLAFWTWGAWAGMGAVALASRWRARWAPVLGLVMAAVPVALNWRAVDRAHAPERDVPRRFAEAMLASADSNAVLITAGDNDTFPLWFAQAVEGLRPDVTVVAAPLLGAEWYRAQLARRDGLLDVTTVRDSTLSEHRLVQRVVEGARRTGRPVDAALTLDARLRSLIDPDGAVRGLVTGNSREGVSIGAHVPAVDTTSTRAIAALIGAVPRPRAASVDPAPAEMATYLGCPASYLAAARAPARADSLDSVCKLR